MFQTHLAFVLLQTILFSYTPHPGEFEAKIGDILLRLHKQHVWPLSFGRDFHLEPLKEKGDKSLYLLKKCFLEVKRSILWLSLQHYCIFRNTHSSKWVQENSSLNNDVLKYTQYVCLIQVP